MTCPLLPRVLHPGHLILPGLPEISLGIDRWKARALPSSSEQKNAEISTQCTGGCTVNIYLSGANMEWFQGVTTVSVIAEKPSRKVLEKLERLQVLPT